ncbi:MAG: molybdate ABC transporter substrate-binding protein [Nocardioides sp.]|nr:molybdate ABC transporter substrate-binding protein [Nocardioides sp.]
MVAMPALAGCGSGGDPGSGQTLTVLAAASLKETFTELAEEFEAAHPGVEVSLAFDSSATLAAQAVEGAPADLLATADTRTMADAVDGDALAGDPEVFATNGATVVVPAGNPAGVSSFADLDDDAVTYVVCVEDAPCGAVARTLLDGAGITHDPASLEVDVKAVLAKVVADEADAGIVYVTDATAAGDAVEQVTIPGADAEPLEYPIGVLEQAEQPELAQEFLDLVLGQDGQAVLGDAGFGSP